jgi:hypothetical protein
VPPIHTNEVNRAVGAEISQADKRRLQKFAIAGNVSGLGKVKHREFAMASGEMTLNKDSYVHRRRAKNDRLCANDHLGARLQEPNGQSQEFHPPHRGSGLEPSDRDIKIWFNRKLLGVRASEVLDPIRHSRQVYYRQSHRHESEQGVRWSTRTVGTSLMPMSFAASTLPCPAIIPSAPSMRTGLINPNSLMLTAICLICLAVCVRGFRARGFSWWGFLYLIFNEGMARLLQDRRQRSTPSLFKAGNGSCAA